MDGKKASIILASGSPRRRELLKNAGISFEVMVTDADENVDENMSPAEVVAAISMRKAEAAVNACRKADRERVIIIAADTIVYSGERVLGKPSGRDEAFEFLKLLANNRHDVYTGVTVAFVCGDNVEYARDVCRTEVIFKPLSDKQIEDYINTGEPFDKAGAYAIQGHGEELVERIFGDYDNVVGLPVGPLLRMLEHRPEGF